MTYHTDSAILKHVCINLIPQIMKKYQFTTQEIFTLFEAKKILLNKADEIDRENTK